MPTPSRARYHTTVPSHHSCPPEDDRVNWRFSEMEPQNTSTITSLRDSQNSTPVAGSHVASLVDTIITDSQNTPTIESTPIQVEEELGRPSNRSFASGNEGERQGGFDDYDSPNLGTIFPLIGHDFSSKRLIPLSPCCFLRAGSRFKGTQQSERQVYDVQVEIKHVDMRESFLCGYLRIQGLTEDHPTLTTYFEGEIIGSKYTFLTQHRDWGSNDKVDLTHWAKFSSFRPFSKKAKKGNLCIPHLTQRENIFMRWKEHFLVPDHRVKTINGASFEGFYYICFNQIQGTVSGIYFHAKSEKFQQLELKHVEDRACFAAMEFR
ncbi:unnamed protein product [Blumeria hordei]|uniref:Vesicle-mediated transport protein Vid24 n=2 Tax=Blumeria hordei TaxID=2867405 RepID=A0A383UZ48_BLUHO|nr:vesicle-mediated transport protein Vid24 [Blumeria hordei DH14]SZF04660.1 unnamed protein product [Blumeria hordei]